LNNQHLHPGLKPILDQIARYADACWEAYEQRMRGEMDLEAAFSKVTQLYREAHTTFAILRHVRPQHKQARRHLWTCALLHIRLRQQRQAHFEMTRRDRPPERTEDDAPGQSDPPAA